MKRRKKAAKAKTVEFPVWTYEQAERALPYITSVMGSIREQYLALVRQQRASRQLAEQPGRPDRQAIIAKDETDRQVRRTEEELTESVSELLKLNVQCVDPVNGLGMIPFVQEGQLAWYVFDLFAEQKLGGWRFHQDALNTRRPLEEVAQTTPSPALKV